MVTSPLKSLVKILNSVELIKYECLEHSRINLSSSILLVSMKFSTLLLITSFGGIPGTKQPGHLSDKHAQSWKNSL
jgi:hypothetical protein